jgi:hypothetical protein
MRALLFPAFERPRKVLGVVVVIPTAIVASADSDCVDCPRPDSSAARIVMCDQPDTGTTAHDALSGPWPNHALQRTAGLRLGFNHGVLAQPSLSLSRSAAWLFRVSRAAGRVIEFADSCERGTPPDCFGSSPSWRRHSLWSRRWSGSESFGIVVSSSLPRRHAAGGTEPEQLRFRSTQQNKLMERNCPWPLASATVAG